MEDTERFTYKQYTVTARFLKEVDRFFGDDEREPAMWRNQFMVTVKNTETGVRRGFTFTGSNRDYEAGITYLETDGLKYALSCFLEDAASGDLSFSDFCSEMGYDEDSRKAYRIHAACKKALEKVTALGLDVYEDGNALRE